MNKVEIVISLPVHERPDIVKNQIYNILHFVKNCVIVIHISEYFNKTINIKEIENIDNVVINEEHIKTSWGNITLAHISNFEYAKTLFEFDYFIMHASNDMYVKSGINDYIKQYEAGFNRRIIGNNKSYWWPAECANNDKELMQILKIINSNKLVASQIEGSFYSKKIFEQIVEVIKKANVTELNNAAYTKEEFYFSTIAYTMTSDVGYPTTFSEIHRFDRNSWNFYKAISTFMPSKSAAKISSVYDKILFRVCKIKKRDVLRILKNDKNFLWKNSYIDDGNGIFRLYGDDVFSVKRVDRSFCRLRKFITNLENVNNEKNNKKNS